MTGGSREATERFKGTTKPAWQCRPVYLEPTSFRTPFITVGMAIVEREDVEAGGRRSEVKKAGMVEGLTQREKTVARR